MGYDVYGCDLNKKFYENIFCRKTEMNINVVCADIRNLPYSDEMFDIVRHNASFLHMPLIGRGYTIDKCIEESYRVLKKKGILYILTKYGDGYVCIDTGDGMGTRPFQFINEEIMGNLLHEHGFNVLHSTVYSR